MAELEEREIYAALGMEPPSQQPEAADPAAGANEQGAANPDGAGNQQNNTGNSVGDGGTPHPSPAATPSPQREGFGRDAGKWTARQDEGSGGQPGTAPTKAGGVDRQDPGADGKQNAESSDTQDGSDGKGTMSRAERAEQARLRRERETQAAVDRAVEAERAKHQVELKTIFSKAGMTDRYNGGKPITTLEEFNAWQERAQTERLSRQLRDGSLTPETFQQAVEDSPAVREAKSYIEAQKAREAEQARAAEQAHFERQVAAELEEIHKLDPGVKTLEDIVNLPTGQSFVALVRDREMSYLEAFKLANMDRMIQARSMAAAQGAALSQTGKQHLRSVVSSSGNVPLEVPRETVEIYRQLNPAMTLDQIREDYARFLQGQ